jgi:hypothetical protein
VGFPWKQVLNVGLMIAGAVIPGVGAVEQIAKTIPGMKGQQKQDAVVALVKSSLEAAEGISGKDLLNDADVLQATRAVIDATVALQNIIAAKRAAQAPTGD